MKAWHDGRLCAFDVETTGVDCDTDRIVTAAITTVGGGEQVSSIAWLIDPGVPIAEEATAVHGVTNEKAQAEGTPAAEAIPPIVRMLSEQIQHDRPIVAFNARFDLTMLDREARRYGVEPLDLERLRVIDPLVIDKWLHRFRRGSRKLDAMCAHYGATLDSAHEATADALAAARLAYRLLHKTDAVQGRHPEIVQRRTFWKLVRDDLDALHSAQVGWAREQAIGLRSYFEGRGEVEKAASVSEDWPLIPAAVAA